MGKRVATAEPESTRGTVGHWLGERATNETRGLKKASQAKLTSLCGDLVRGNALYCAHPTGPRHVHDEVPAPVVQVNPLADFTLTAGQHVRPRQPLLAVRL